MRIIFAGTPDFSVAPLEALIAAGHEIVAVYTQPDRPAGRGRKLTPSPVKQAALAHQLPVFQPENFKSDDAIHTLKAHQADIMVVVAYGLILPKAILETPTYGCLNIHASLLPRWRGAAPIQRAIEAGDAETGVTIMQMAEGLDTGDMRYQVSTPIHPTDTAQTLHDRLSQLGAEAIVTVLKDLDAFPPAPQDESLATYAHKLHKAEAELDWTLPAQILQRKIQAFNPWPVAFTHLEDKPLRIWQAQIAEAEKRDENVPESPVLPPGTLLRVSKTGIDVQTGAGVLRLLQVQPSGKKAMSAYDFAQARALEGVQLGQNPKDPHEDPNK
ncbi:methionyl-tRNA formyltransferase [Galenea microaerophila]